MKKTFIFAAMLAIAASCTVYEIESVKGTTAPEITASYESNGTKTAITTDDEGVGTIWWKPADEINVFYGTVSTHYTSKNMENATTVAFGTTDIIGSTESAQENIWGLYPYDGNAVCDGESVTTTIPATQKAVAGTFDDDIFTSLAHSTSTTMTFYNVLGGIKFSLSRDDIQTITFKGNNNENIAGKVSLSMDAGGKPVAEITEGKKAITLTPKEGTTFASNTNYYIVLLPTVLSNGFTMTFETETALGTFEYTAKSIEIKRSVFSKKENIDSYAEFLDKPDLDPEYVDLGLRVMWATCNLGATSSEQIGNFYAWGEIEPKDIYNWGSYKWCNGSYDSLTKYVWDDSYGVFDDKEALDPEDDAAIVNLGGKWRMPTDNEFRQLIEKCVMTCDEINGVQGYTFTSSINGNSIFFPSGIMLDDSIRSYTEYWSSSLQNGGSMVWGMLIFDESLVLMTPISRNQGLPIRPVYEEHVHYLEHLEGKTPTNMKSGYKDCYQCLGCSKYFEDSEGTIAIDNYDTWKSTGRGYLPPVPYEEDYVDLGLPSGLLWATCNLGASSPEEYGDYIAWGETEPQSKYIESSNKWFTYYDGDRAFTKYTTSTSSHNYAIGTPDNKATLDLEDDSARVNLGDNWRTPTSAEWGELIDNCSYFEYTLNGIKGVVFSSKTDGFAGREIFLPKAGNMNNSKLNACGPSYFQAYYMSSSLKATDNYFCLCFVGTAAPYIEDVYRYYGISVRPVKNNN